MPDNRVPKDPRVLRDHKVQKDPLVHQETLVIKDLKAIKDNKVQPVQTVSLAIPARQEQLDHLGQMEIQDKVGHQEMPGKSVLKVILDHRDCRVHKGRVAHQDQQDCKALQELKETQVTKVTQDLQDPREQQEIQVRNRLVMLKCFITRMAGRGLKRRLTATILDCGLKS